MSDLQNSVWPWSPLVRGEEAGAVAEAIRKSGGRSAAFRCRCLHHSPFETKLIGKGNM